MKQTDVVVAEQQLNVKIPRTSATSAKRMARKHGMTLNALITKLIDDATVSEAGEMAEQFEEEQRRALAEYAEMQAYLKKMSDEAAARAAQASAEADAAEGDTQA
ncbi:hypothetical protein [Nocardia salmonicida]|uniref:hypothetical protein n=1 Tax=Nocardia salmonicida TaxID=53431 RepID=UPI002E2B9FDB|nr:hypothetical protein [Nocardia salmonicida]